LILYQENPMRWPILLCVLFLTGCMHLKGIVLDESSMRPARTAVFSVGNPTGIAVFETHRVDDNGEFDFYLGPTDDNNLYLYDGSALPALTLRRIGKFEMGENMKLYLRRASHGTPALPDGANFTP
jgi:hypothetical protein